MTEKVKIFISILLVLVVMCGCRIQEDAQNPVPKTELVFVYQYDDTNVIQSIIRDFNDENDDVRVRTIELSSSADENYRILSSLLQGGELGIDVFLCDDIWNREFIERGYVCELNSYVNINGDEYPEGVLRTLTKDGKVYGIPFMLDVGVMAYRSDAVPKKTDFRELEDSYSFIYDDTEDILCVVRECIQLTGNTKSGLELYKNLYDKSLSKESGEVKYTRTWTGRLKGVKNWLGGDSGIVKATPLIQSENGQSYAIARLYSIMVNAAAPDEKQQAIKKFIEYMALENTQKMIMEVTGSIPVKYKYYDDNKVQDYNEYNVMFKDIIDSLTYRNSANGYMSDTINIYEVIYEYLNGKVSLDDTCRAMDGLLQGGE